MMPDLTMLTIRMEPLMLMALDELRAMSSRQMDISIYS